MKQVYILSLIFLTILGRLPIGAYTFLHPAPIFMSTDSAFHINHAIIWAETGQYGLLPPYAAEGYPDIEIRQPPLFPIIVSSFSVVTGIPVYDVVYIIILFLVAFLTVSIFFFLKQAFSSTCAYMGAIAFALPLSTKFLFCLNAGMFPQMSGIVFLVLSMWSFSRYILTKKQVYYVISVLLVSGLVYAHFAEFPIFLAYLGLIFLYFVYKKDLRSCCMICLLPILVVLLVSPFIPLARAWFHMGHVSNKPPVDAFPLYHPSDLHPITYLFFPLGLWACIRKKTLASNLILFSVISYLFFCFIHPIQAWWAFRFRLTVTPFIYPLVGVGIYYLLSLKYGQFRLPEPLKVGAILMMFALLGLNQNVYASYMHMPEWLYEGLKFPRLNLSQNATILSIGQVQALEFYFGRNVFQAPFSKLQEGMRENKMIGNWSPVTHLQLAEHKIYRRTGFWSVKACKVLEDKPGPCYHPPNIEHVCDADYVSILLLPNTVKYFERYIPHLLNSGFEEVHQSGGLLYFKNLKKGDCYEHWSA